MSFKDSSAEFQMIDLALIEPDASHPRQNVEESSLKGLANSIQKVGVIHPLIVRPANAAGRYTVIVGERRRQASLQAGETKVPVVIRGCSADEALEVQVFENIGLGVRAGLEPRDMANAIQTIAERFETQEAAAQHFGRAPTWLNQATAAANLSEKVTALLDSGKISSTSAAVQLEKLAKKDEAKADVLIDQIEQLPEGEKVSKKVVDNALSEAGGTRKKKTDVPPPEPETSAPVRTVDAEPSSPLEPAREAEAINPARTRVNAGKIKRVAEILGLSDGDEDEVLDRLIDEFLALKNA